MRGVRCIIGVIDEQRGVCVYFDWGVPSHDPLIVPFDASWVRSRFRPGTGLGGRLTSIRERRGFRDIGIGGPAGSGVLFHARPDIIGDGRPSTAES